MERRHVFELEDQPWFPAAVRDLSTDYLHFLQTVLGLHRPTVSIVADTLQAAGTTRIVDLCSGGAGPLPLLVRDLARRGIEATVTLTDLFPNRTAFARAVAGGHGAITFSEQPVDARAVPVHLTGLRTMFNGFHHFRPADAAAILRDAAASHQPIAIFEMSERSVRRLLAVVLTPILVWLSTPFIRPFRWERLLLTYAIPLVPLTCLWDGIVSQLRAYTPAELLQLAEAAGRMEWAAGYLPFPIGPGRLTYLVGRPVLRTRRIARDTPVTSPEGPVR
jgi:hypothetical protein